jgi:hypothetical protein
MSTASWVNVAPWGRPVVPLEAKFRPKGPNEFGEFALGHDHLYPGVAEDRPQVRLGQPEVHGRRDDAELRAGDEN